MRGPKCDEGTHYPATQKPRYWRPFRGRYRIRCERCGKKLGWVKK